MRHRASAPDFSSAAEAAAGCWKCSKMLLLFFSRCKKQTPSTGVCSQQDSVLYAFEHLQYSISGFAPKEQNCANVVTIWTDELLPKIQKAVYALNCGFEQKTQVTEQLLIIEKTITDDKAKQVFWSHIISFFERKIEQKTCRKKDINDEQKDG